MQWVEIMVIIITMVTYTVEKGTLVLRKHRGVT